MKCPICTTIDLLMTERQGVEIDYCPQCRGVWLDRGELDKIIEKSMAQQPPAVQAPPPAARPIPQPMPQQGGQYYEQKVYRKEHHDHDDHDHHGHDDHDEWKRHKKKSIWGEIFDF